MKKFLSATIIAVSAAVLNSAVIDIVADKADAYQVGETINFKVTGKEKNKKLITFYLFPIPHIVKYCYKLYEVNDNAKAYY